MNRYKRIMVVEDDGDFCFLIEDMLGREKDMEVCGTARNAREAVQLAERLSPDLVLMDLNLSCDDLDGVEASREIRLRTNARVVILTAYEDPKIVTQACKRAFASGYVFKSQLEILPETLRSTAAGPSPQELLIQALLLADLSPAERAVFSMMMGEDLHLQSSQKTISNQKTALLRKLGLKSRKELLHIFKPSYFNTD